MLNKRLPSVETSHFAYVPQSDVPRSKFRTPFTYKTTFDAGFLVPIFVDEVLPGDMFRGSVTSFARLAALLLPVMDNMQLETFFFFVPNRLVWQNWERFMGEQINPSDSISFLIPQIVSPAGGFNVGSIYDYFGIPTVGQITGGLTVSISALPLRAYHLIYNEWFRDENLTLSAAIFLGDGPDTAGSYGLLRRKKKHDYFTSALPWPLKGGIDVSLPLAGTAIVRGIGLTTTATGLAGPSANLRESENIVKTYPFFVAAETAGNLKVQVSGTGTNVIPQIFADLSTATATTINALRLAITAQQYLEKDARGGTRYTEMIRSHFGVMSPDARLQRPEYIGGGISKIETAAIPQTSAAGITGSSTPQGNLAAQATIAGEHSFSYSATEHGHIIGLVHVGADLTYQQGLAKMWSRSTRFDFYVPVFANLGEQAVLNKEIYLTGTLAQDNAVFGYQERWAEYRYFPSKITGIFRSTAALNIDEWHLSQQFTALPTLNATFIDDTPPMSRVLAAGTLANGQQILYDSFFDMERTRCMPQYSVPGLSRF